LPADLPRVRQVHPLAAEDQHCPACGTARVQVAEKISAQLDYHPASLFVVEHVRPVCVCPKCQGQVAVAPVPVQPIEKGLPGPGLVAQVLVSKYADHLPLHRQEAIFRRHGVELPRSTTCGWCAAAATRLEPLWERTRARILLSRVIQTDDTVVPVLDDRRAQTKTGRQWAYVGDVTQPLILFDYTPDRSHDGPQRILAGYQGYLQADAYAGYDFLFAAGLIREVACWAHARRKFHDARQTDAPRACAMLGRIRQLYALEAEARDRGRSEAQRHDLRQERAPPLLQSIHQWLLAEQPAVLPKSPIGEAISYALNQWTALNRYLEQGFLEIDNNAVERALRVVAVGRKNWLFAGADAGGRTQAILYTLIASAKRHGVDPYLYLRHVLLAVHTTSVQQIDDLLPDAWARQHPAQRP
jgi:transposase